MKAVEIYACVVLLWYLKETWMTKSLHECFMSISNTDGKPLPQLCSIWFTSPLLLLHPSPLPLLDSAEAVAGMLLTMAGITLCVISSVDDAGPRDVTH